MPEEGLEGKRIAVGSAFQAITAQKESVDGKREKEKGKDSLVRRGRQIHSVSVNGKKRERENYRMRIRIEKGKKDYCSRDSLDLRKKKGMGMETTVSRCCPERKIKKKNKGGRNCPNFKRES